MYECGKSARVCSIYVYGNTKAVHASPRTPETDLNAEILGKEETRLDFVAAMNFAFRG